MPPEPVARISRDAISRITPVALPSIAAEFQLHVALYAPVMGLCRRFCHRDLLQLLERRSTEEDISARSGGTAQRHDRDRLGSWAIAVGRARVELGRMRRSWACLLEWRWC